MYAFKWYASIHFKTDCCGHVFMIIIEVFTTIKGKENVPKIPAQKTKRET